MPLSVDTQPTTERSDSLRALIAAAGVGMVLTLTGAVALDSLALRRRAAPSGRARRSSRSAGAAEPSRTGRPDASRPTDTAPAQEWSDDRPPAAQWPATVPHIESRDFARSEERYGSQWPPKASDEPALGDDARLAPRA